MAKSMWVRCPKCNTWCYAEKKNMLGRLLRSVSDGDKSLGKYYGDIADNIGMKSIGKSAGRALNVFKTPLHIGEMLNGDNYRFHCKECGNEFGTDNEDVDMTAERELFVKALELRSQFPSMKDKSNQEKENYTAQVEETLAKVEESTGIDDAKAVLHDTLASCYHYLLNDSSKALLEINKSLSLYDDDASHVLKGIFMGTTSNPSENYAKMNELLRISDCDPSPYFDKSTVERELELSERMYCERLISFPANQRKFLVVTSDYSYLPDSFKVIKYDHAPLTGIQFENGFPNKNAIYVCHPYKTNVYYPSESYQSDLFKNQLNEFRELLQCLGAKSITTENTHNHERSGATSSNLSGKVGGEYGATGANVSGELNNSNSVMESMVQTMLINDGFSLNPDMYPHVPEGLAWFDHMEEWQRLARMRLRGQNKYSISISSKTARLVNENEAKQVNADFKALVAKGNIEISQSSELKTYEGNAHEWKMVVEFYPLSDYGITKPNYKFNQFGSSNRMLPEKSNQSAAAVSKNFFIATIAILVAIIAALVIFVFLK